MSVHAGSLIKTHPDSSYVGHPVCPHRTRSVRVLVQIAAAHVVPHQIIVLQQVSYSQTFQVYDTLQCKMLCVCVCIYTQVI